MLDEKINELMAIYNEGYEKGKADRQKACWITRPNCEGYAEYGICSNCHHKQGAPQIFNKKKYKYCPNCGAEMSWVDKYKTAEEQGL